MSSFATIVAACLFGYLVGSIPIALMVAERHGVHIRAVGDHNPGFLNATSFLGVRSALPVLVGDVAKGAIAGVVGLLLADDGQWWLPVVATAAAMLGHAFPILAEFKGGRGAMTFVGGALAFAPLPTLAAIALALVVAVVLRLAGVAGAIRIAIWVGLAVLPVLLLFVEPWVRAVATAGLLLFVLARVTITRPRAEPAEQAVYAG